ncbi:MAG: DNA adenine methylase [Planctomycetes bacterium]|nr:DNA adenine methylase [Planctomycetota bacterium]
MNGPRDVPQPIPYQGSKRQIAPNILRHFPAAVSRLVEPFAGSAAMSIAVAARRRADSFWINDGHSPLIKLWREIIHRPDELADQYTLLWNDQLGCERKYFDRVRSRFNRDHHPADFLYLLARCVKAAIRYNAKGQFNNTPDNRRRGARPAGRALKLPASSQFDYCGEPRQSAESPSLDRSARSIRAARCRAEESARCFRSAPDSSDERRAPYKWTSRYRPNAGSQNDGRTLESGRSTRGACSDAVECESKNRVPWAACPPLRQGKTQ